MIHTLSVTMSESSFLSLCPSATAGTVSLTLVIAFLVSVYSYVKIKHRYWKKRGVSGPPAVFPTGTAVRPAGIAWHDDDLQNIVLYGKVHGIYAGIKPVLVVADNYLLRDIFVRDFSSFSERASSFHKILSQNLISSNGKRWKEQRTIISPTFTSGKMKAMHHLMKQAVDNLMKHMDEEIAAGSPDFNNKELYGDLTLGVIARCAFATDTNSHQKHGDNVFVKNTKLFFQFSRLRLLAVALIPTAILRWFEFNVNPQEAMDFMIGMSRTILEQRRRQGKNTGQYVDLLQLMMDSEVKGEDGVIHTLTDDEIIGNIILVLIAGYETTGSLLTYATYSLAINPEVQAKLRQEVEEAVAADGGDIKYDTVMNLKYLDAVVNETLRHYPPVIRSERTATADYEFKSQGIRIEKGTKVYIPIHAIHHMSEYYPDPYLFNPERFMPENKEKLVPYTFLPFLTGPRNCIGSRFALLEAKTALAAIILKYDISKSEKTAVPLDFSKSLMVLTPEKVIVNYTVRK